MTKSKDWKEFINNVLIDSGQFESPTSEQNNQTEIERYKISDKDSLTEIRVGYLEDNLLIFLEIFNPMVPGYTKYVAGEYFYQHDFNPPREYGNPGLEFNKRNQNGVLSILKNGLKGKEVQFLKNNKILKSKLYIVETDKDFNYSYHFAKRNLWNKIFGRKIEDIDGVEKQEIDLSTVFSGIRIPEFNS